MDGNSDPFLIEAAQRYRNEIATSAAPVEQSEGGVSLITENPFEQIIERALIKAGIAYQADHDGSNPTHLDFYLPEYDVHVEVKTMHSERIAEQMSRAPNVIVAQGKHAIEFLARRLGGARPPSLSARAAAEEIREWIGISGLVDGKGIDEVVAIIERHCYRK